jgi:ABC-type phosphate/phosphonate transport system permease subunit
VRVEVDIAGEGNPDRAVRRLLLVLGRFAPEVVSVDLRVAPAGPGKVRLTARVALDHGGGLALQTADEAGAAALEHFIDRLGRSVARRLARRGA